LLENKVERTEHVNRIKALLASRGLSISVNAQLPEVLKQLRQWNDAEVPP
jgi:hypothetical protein